MTSFRLSSLRVPVALPVLALVLSLALSGCQQSANVQPINLQSTVAISGFVQPSSIADLLAGGAVPEGAERVSPDILEALDEHFSTLVREGTKRSVAGPGVTRQCREIVISRQRQSPTSALRYWLQVGECVPADFLVVPYVYAWRERDGGEMGVTSPASVSMDFYLVDVKAGLLVRRSRFNVTQQSLFEDVLNARTFFSRGGKWVTARELADEAMRQAIRELGL